MTPAVPAGPPDGWLTPGTPGPAVIPTQRSTGPPAEWAAPSPDHWRPHHPTRVVTAASGGSANGPLIGLLVVLLVAVMAAAGVASTRSRDDAFGDRNPTPEAVATPTVSPQPAGTAGEPEPPPDSAVGSTDPATGRWLLPEWTWDVLPTLAADQEEAWQTLQAESLAAITPPSLTGCEAPHIVKDEASYQDAVKRQWRCVHEAWTPIFQTLGWSTVEPTVKFFTGAGTTSACGFATAPAFYCPSGGGVAFFGGDDRDLAMYWDLTINESVHHEYAHHVQNLAGMMDAVEEVTPTDDLDRRLELQATCLSASMTFRNDAVGFDQERWDDWQYSLNESVLDSDHGSRESLLYWGTRGLYAATLGDCNTWSVEPDRVD